MAGGFRQWVGGLLRFGSEVSTLGQEQRTAGGEPVVTLTIGAHTLDAFVWGYRYEEIAESNGSLVIWLDNRGDEFDDLANDYPDLKRGAAVDLRRGLPVNDVDTTEKLPRCWIESMRYVFLEGAALLRLSCIDWRGRAERYRYSTSQSWNETEVATIAGAILGQVSLTLASGTFGISIDYAVGVRQNAESAVQDLMLRVEEYLYAGLDGEVKHKALDPAEASGYTYGWNANHPLLWGTEAQVSSPRFNKIVVSDSTGVYSGSAQDATEIALVGTRLRTVTDPNLSSNAECAERAQAELRYWQAQKFSGTLVARPHFTLELYDMVTVAAPPWGGAQATARVTRIVEEYGQGLGKWHQIITLGALPLRGRAGTRDATVNSPNIVEGSITADEIAANAVTAGKIDVDNLSAISADMGTLTAGVIKMGSGTKDSDLDGFQLDSAEIVGQASGEDQVSLAAATGKLTAGAGAVVLDAGGIHTQSGVDDVNKLKVEDDGDILLAAYAEVDSGVGTSATLEAIGKDATSPEGMVELLAKTYNGAAHSGVASITITLETENGKITLGGASRMVMGTVYFELTEQSADPAAPGANRGRLYLRDNGSGKTQLCIRFNTGAVQVIATEP